MTSHIDVFSIVAMINFLFRLSKVIKNRQVVSMVLDIITSTYSTKHPLMMQWVSLKTMSHENTSGYLILYFFIFW